MLSNKEDDNIVTLKENSDNRSPLYFPYYMTLVSGQFVAVLGFLHAALPLGLPSYIVGALSTILNTIYFVSVGYVINSSYNDIQDLKSCGSIIIIIMITMLIIIILIHT